MRDPKLHHYVPQFHLRRFLNRDGKHWVWDKRKDTIFATAPGSIAAETGFYFLADFAEQGHDPLTMERQFSGLEHQVSLVTTQWLQWLREIEIGEKIDIPIANREVVSLHIALQFLRTADTRDILVAAAEVTGRRDSLNRDNRRRLHTSLIWDEGIFRPIADRICGSTWVFGRNSTSTPFVTSDNPVAFRTSDNAMWLKAGFMSFGTYVVFPLAPDIIMYCYPREAPWDKLERFDACLSPVEFTEGMIESENSGQVFMSSRFVISKSNAFTAARDFATSIGTDRYAGKRTSE